MDATIFFIVALCSQTFLLSWYLPKRVQARMRYVFDNYPYEQYPKLYGGNLDRSQKNYRIHIFFNNLMFSAGIGLIIGVAYLGDSLSNGLLAIGSFVYGMLQAIPLIVMDFVMMKHCKKLRDEYDSPQRSASLTPRSIFNHTSMAMMMLVFSFYLMASVFDMYTKGFDFSLGFELFEGVAVLTGVNMFFVLMIRWRVYGKKLNPLTSPKDDKKEIDAIVQSTLFVSAAASIFIMTMRAVNVYDLEQFEGLLMSLYMQAIIVYSIIFSLNQNKVEDMNLEMYRAESGSQA
ncbi:MAG: hypothetical protein VW882_10900 [Gammaproteobacteria bacterium]